MLSTSSLPFDCRSVIFTRQSILILTLLFWECVQTFCFALFNPNWSAAVVVHIYFSSSFICLFFFYRNTIFVLNVARSYYFFLFPLVFETFINACFVCVSISIIIILFYLILDCWTFVLSWMRLFGCKSRFSPEHFLHAWMYILKRERWVQLHRTRH